MTRTHSKTTKRRRNITTRKPIAVAEHLTKFYGRRRAVDDVSFELERGQVLGLLGPNGSGKSTILRMLVGYVRPSSGRARIAGHDVTTDGSAARANIGYVPEDAPLYNAMRVDEFLRSMAALKGIEAGAVAQACARVQRQLALDDVTRVVIRQLSRGYRQRVAIAQALLTEPPLLIMDEPTNGLDPRQIIEWRTLIQSLAGSHAILITSHILGEIEKVADRAAILRDGRLLAVVDVHDQHGGRVDLEARFLELTADAA